MARRRRTREEIAFLREVIMGVVSTNAPMTVRQVFYQLVSLGVIDKTDGEYNNVVVRHLTRLRLDGELPMELDYRRHAVDAQVGAVREHRGGTRGDEPALSPRLLARAR